MLAYGIFKRKNLRCFLLACWGHGDLNGGHHRHGCRLIKLERRGRNKPQAHAYLAVSALNQLPKAPRGCFQKGPEASCGRKFLI